MAGRNPTWFRRHRRAVFASITAMVVLAGGFWLVSAVHQLRIDVSRSGDL